MLSLCIETASSAVSVAIGDEHRVLASAAVHEGRRHAETLIPAADALLRFLQRDRRELTHIGVDVGPGLFTGLRVGVATAKGLALALGLPVAPFTSLELLAAAAGEVGVTGRVITVLDARRSELYAAAFELGPDGDRVVVAPFVAPAREVAERCAPLAGSTLVGDGVDVADPSGVAAGLASVTAPDACTIARLLGREHHRGSLAARLRSGDTVELTYLRASDAELQAAARREAS